jgi:hypothetical protein
MEIKANVSKREVKITLTPDQIKDVSYALNMRATYFGDDATKEMRYLCDQFDNLRRFLSI